MSYGILQLVVGVLLLSIAWIDFWTYRIPDVLILGLFALFILGLFLSPFPEADHLGGAGLALSLSLLLKKGAVRFLKKEALGLGDVKLMTVGGLWLGLHALPVFCILSGFLGIGTWIALQARKAIFPFGPSLCLSWILVWVWETFVTL